MARPAARVLLLAAVAVAGAAPRVNPQAQAQPQTFEERAQVLAVEVPVNVVTRDGEPVRGLTAADFELFEEGKRQAIQGFEVVDLEVTVPEEGAAAPRPEPSNSGRRRVLLLFDLSFARPAGILRARVAARETVLRALHSEDLVAVATYSHELGPRLLVTFTTDRAQVARAIDTLGLRPRGELATLNLDPLRFLVAPPASPGSGAGTDASPSRRALDTEDPEAAVREHLTIMNQQIDRSQRAFDRSRVSGFTRAIAELARVLASVPGRKHVVLLSEGFDSRLLLGRKPEADNDEQDRDRLNLSLGRSWLVDMDQLYGDAGLLRDTEVMLEQFRRADCVIQAVDVGGLRAGGDLRSAGAFGEDALFLLANETGGELFRDLNDIGEQLDRLLRRTAVTYLLTFHPSDVELDGAYRRLRVKLRPERPGVHLSHRGGYYRPRPFPDLDPLEKSLLAADAITSPRPAADFPVEVLVAPFRASERSAYVPVIIEVNGAALLAGTREDHLAVEIYAYVADEQGEMRDFFSQVIGLDLAKNRAALARSGLKYYGHFDLPPGRYQVRTLVRNAGNGARAASSVALEIPDYGAARPTLLPPFFLEPPGRWILVRESAGPVPGRTVVYPFTVNGEPYVPAAHLTLGVEERARLCLVAYNLGGGETAVEARVLRDDGQFALTERTATGIEGLDKLLASFEADGLGAGRYTLQVAVTDPTTGTVQTNSIPFSVVD
jgi:VWFA-related protein